MANKPLKAMITIDGLERTIVITYDRPITSTAMSAEQALKVCNKLLAFIEELEKRHHVRDRGTCVCEYRFSTHADTCETCDCWNADKKDCAFNLQRAAKEARKAVVEAHCERIT
jgi:hypothetical protein